MNTQTDVPRQSTTSLSRSRRRILPAEVVAAAVIVVALGNVGDTSMVHGRFPVVLFWVTVAHRPQEAPDRR